MTAASASIAAAVELLRRKKKYVRGSQVRFPMVGWGIYNYKLLFMEVSAPRSVTLQHQTRTVYLYIHVIMNVCDV